MAGAYTSTAKFVRYAAAADTPNIDSSGAAAEFAFPGGPVRVLRVGVDVTTAVVSDNSTALDLTMTRRPVRGSTSNAVTLGTFRVAAAGVDPAAGAVIYKDLAIVDNDGEQPEDYSASASRAKRFEAPNADITGPITKMDPFIILPGQSLALTLAANAEADSGAVQAWVEVEELPLTGVFKAGANISRDTTNE